MESRPTFIEKLYITKEHRNLNLNSHREIVRVKLGFLCIGLCIGYFNLRI